MGDEQPSTGSDGVASLEFLGDLVDVAHPAVTETFDTDGGTFALGDGATIEAPSGAFADPTDVTATVADVAFDRFADGAGRGTAYVVSTERDVALGEPVVLVVPTPSGSVRVVQRVDDRWERVEVSPGTSTRVPIAHFSEVVTIVAEPGSSAPEVPTDDLSGDAPGEFLAVCIPTVAWLLGPSDVDQDPAAAAFANQLAFSFCARALVKKYSPDGQYVPVACVGEQMSLDVEFRAAIAACADADDDAAAEPTSTTQPPSAGEVADAAPADRSVDGTYRGQFDVSEFFGEDALEPDMTIDANGIEVAVVGGAVVSITGQFAVGGPCEQGPNAGAHLALYYLLDGSADDAVADESNGWTVTLPATFTTDARGSCPPPEDDDGIYIAPEEFETTFGVDATVDLSLDGAAALEIVADEVMLTSTLTRG